MLQLDLKKALRHRAFANAERSGAFDEMARDEARHGRALKGLLDRYFGK